MGPPKYKKDHRAIKWPAPTPPKKHPKGRAKHRRRVGGRKKRRCKKKPRHCVRQAASKSHLIEYKDCSSNSSACVCGWRTKFVLGYDFGYLIVSWSQIWQTWRFVWRQACPKSHILFILPPEEVKDWALYRAPKGTEGPNRVGPSRAQHDPVMCLFFWQKKRWLWHKSNFCSTASRNNHFKWIPSVRSI